jgi:hypothetical protein
LLIECKGPKEIECAQVPPVVEPRRQDAHDFMRVTVDPDRPADDIASTAKALLPAALTKNNDVVVSSYVFACEKITT